MKNFDYPVSNDELLLENQQEMPMQEREAFNPFDLGIKKAIEQSRQNLGMNQQQQHRAINNALSSFGNAISKEPVVSGFKNNLGVFGRAMNPALQSYNQSEDIALKENNNLAQQILAHRRAEENARRQEEEKAYQRDFAERQFGALEQFRQAKLMQDQAKSSDKKKAKGKNHGSNNSDDRDLLEEQLKKAKQTVTTNAKKGSRGILKRFANKFVPGGIPLTPEQAEINTVGDILRGKLFNAWGYSNQAEFEHIPSVSPDNDPATNLAIINQLQNMLDAVEHTSVEDANNDNINNKTLDDLNYIVGFKEKK